MRLENKVVLITGGASGFGLSFVENFLENGVKGIVVADMDLVRGREALSALEEKYGHDKIITCVTDVTDEAQLRDAFQKCVQKFDQLDIVINNAGIFDERNSKRTIDINLIAVLRGTQIAVEEFLPKFMSADYGVVVNISSIYGLDGCECGAAYSASKHGVIGIGKSFSTATHYQSNKVKILTLCPGHSSSALCDSINDKILPLVKYKNMCEKLWNNLYHQKSEFVAKCLMKILGDFETGDFWLIEDDKCHQVRIPTRNELEKIKTLTV